MRRDGPPDKRLFRRARHGDREAFGALLRRYDPRLRRLTLRLVAEPSRVDPVLSRAYLRAWRSLAHVEPPESVAEWLYRLVYNACINEVRWAPAKPMPDPPSGPWIPLPLATPARRLAGLRALSPEDRVPLVLVDGEGFSIPAAARILRRPEADVATDVTRARQLWRRLVVGDPTPRPPESRPHPKLLPASPDAQMTPDDPDDDPTAIASDGQGDMAPLVESPSPIEPFPSANVDSAQAAAGGDSVTEADRDPVAAVANTARISSATSAVPNAPTDIRAEGTIAEEPSGSGAALVEGLPSTDGEVAAAAVAKRTVAGADSVRDSSSTSVDAGALAEGESLGIGPAGSDASAFVEAAAPSDTESAAGAGNDEGPSVVAEGPSGAGAARVENLASAGAVADGGRLAGEADAVSERSSTSVDAGALAEGESLGIGPAGSDASAFVEVAAPSDTESAAGAGKDEGPSVVVDGRSDSDEATAAGARRAGGRAARGRRRKASSAEAPAEPVDKAEESGAGANGETAEPGATSSRARRSRAAKAEAADGAIGTHRQSADADPDADESGAAGSVRRRSLSRRIQRSFGPPEPLPEAGAADEGEAAGDGGSHGASPAGSNGEKATTQVFVVSAPVAPEVTDVSEAAAEVDPGGGAPADDQGAARRTTTAGGTGAGTRRKRRPDVKRNPRTRGRSVQTEGGATKSDSDGPTRTDSPRETS